MRVLLLGARSFVATGLYTMLKSANYPVECFCRGEERKEADVVFGDVYKLSQNNYLSESYDTVINFVVIKDGDLQKNIDYIKSVIDFCKAHQVKKLIHFSSVMVYNYQLKKVDENTGIETLEETTKKGYGEFKIAVDQYLMKEQKDLPFEVIFVRPGYILAEGRPCPFIKKLPLGISVIKGNRQSKQPIVRREEIHEALIKIIETPQNNPVYHFFPNDDMTKYRYAKQSTKGLILTLPKWLLNGIPCLLSKAGIIPKSLYSRFEGMYIETRFCSKETEKTLNIKFH